MKKDGEREERGMFDDRRRMDEERTGVQEWGQRRNEMEEWAGLDHFYMKALRKFPSMFE